MKNKSPGLPTSWFIIMALGIVVTVLFWVLVFIGLVKYILQ